MRYKIIFGILGVVILVLIIFISVGVQKTKIPKEMPQNFEIYYSYGVGEGNIFDTKNNLYIKDMICDPVRNYSVILSDMEKQTIYKSILENDFFNLPSDMTPSARVMCQPPSGLTLKITAGQSVHTIKWRCGFPEQNPNYKKLTEITKTIRNIISQKEDEIGIEQPKCGYM